MHATTGSLATPDGIRLAYRDHVPGQESAGRTLLLLHGLAGHMGEWDELLPSLLAEGHRVVTYDARGHGASTGRPADMSRAACVRDAVTVIRELGLGDDQDRTHRPLRDRQPSQAPRPLRDRQPSQAPRPLRDRQPSQAPRVPHARRPPQAPRTPLTPLTLVGQSLGGHTAFLAAAAHPDLIHSLILIEAGPGTPDPALPAHIAAWMDSWPTPFDSPSRATDFFGHASRSRNLERRADGWHPRADRATMLAAIEELAEASYDSEWAATICPALVVRGARGTMPAADATRMPAGRAPGARTDLAVIEGAGHDIHLDQPHRLHAAVAGFLNSLSMGSS